MTSNKANKANISGKEGAALATVIYSSLFIVTLPGPDLV